MTFSLPSSSYGLPAPASKSQFETRTNLDFSPDDLRTYMIGHLSLFGTSASMNSLLCKTYRYGHICTLDGPRHAYRQTLSPKLRTLCKVSSYAIARIRRPTMATGNPPELSLTPRQRVTSRCCHDFPYFGHAQSKISENSRLREQNPVALGERTPDGRVSLPLVSTYTRLVQCHSKKLLQLRLSSHNLRTIQLSQHLALFQGFLRYDFTRSCILLEIQFRPSKADSPSNHGSVVSTRKANASPGHPRKRCNCLVSSRFRLTKPSARLAEPSLTANRPLVKVAEAQNDTKQHHFRKIIGDFATSIPCWGMCVHGSIYSYLKVPSSLLLSSWTLQSVQRACLPASLKLISILSVTATQRIL
ncbi:uncharacterized protein CLUP02_03593 [Colletotrichum lupini]|uniref:Uncharacterized protein n=1 Tax=Colletotrichum lupini TaxID=145971 RepID=A0A9Q8SIV6_9PEZI|nr:uncharacterized protein CLUP02_03593 [Colletotrichum lupini]UQC78119.1 hypothetical protein CLUP02_03593 [Colletotrichum lupini]